MKTKTKTAAIVTIREAPDMSKRGRNAIADWLERQAGFLRDNSKQLSKRFTARYIYFPILLCLPLVFTGCKSNDNANVGPALLRLGVSTAASYSLMTHPEAAPGVKVGTAIVCSVAYGTNVSPASIVAALNAAGPMSQEAVFILNAAIGAYTLTFNGLADTNDVVTVRPYTIAVCDGLTDAILLAPGVPAAGVASRNLNWTMEKPQNPSWPQVKFK